jgi:carboxylesterase
MRLLGESLAADGFAVEGPTLAGHASTTRDLARTRWPDWLQSAERSLDSLATRCEKIGVCGLSMGGLLTAELARRRPREVSAIGMLATALWLPERAVRLDHAISRVPLLRDLALPKLAGSDIRDPEMRRRNKVAQGHAAMPLPALHSLVELGEYLKPRLGGVSQPALVAHGRLDHTIPFACMAHVTRSLGSRVITELVLEESFHVLTLDVERETVFRAVAAHMREYLS